MYLGKDENGKRVYESVTRPSEYECLEEANRIAKHRSDVRKNPGLMTLKEAINAYIESRSNVLSPSTIRGYDIIYRNHLKPEMEMQIRKIDNQVAQLAINREAKTSSPKTVENIFGLLKPVVREYVGRELKVKLPQKEEADEVVLTKEECRKLVKAIEGDISEVPILIAMFLGLRRSEILALKHKDWDSENQILSINKARVLDKDLNFVEKTTKTKKSKRKIPVPDYLACKLDECVENDWAFCRMHPSSVDRSLKRFCERCGIPRLGLHALRHQNASVMLSLGVPDKYAMKRGGWSSNATMKRIYQHTMDDKMQEVNDSIDRYYQELAE